MAFDVFAKIAAELNVLPDKIQTAYEEACIESVDEAAVQLEKFYRKNSGSTTLNDHMLPLTKVEIPHVYYARDVDWDDETPVNKFKNKGYGRYRDTPRAARKRNYSKRPATTHDLAYIISVGHGGVVGNQFIKRGLRSIKNRFKKRDAKFKAKCNIIAESLE